MTTAPNRAAVGAQISKASEFMESVARLIDRRRFAYAFVGGGREPVLAALRPYQNADGGFGNALEPDIRGPGSQPVPTWTALCILDEVDAFDDPMVARACDYLRTITTPEGGVPFVLPSVRAHPHAPWWEAPDNPSASLNPTAPLAALLHKHGLAHPWLAPATEYCWREIDAIEQTSPYEMRAVLPFLDAAPDRARAEQAFARLGPMIREQGLVTFAPNAGDDTHSPLHFAPTPHSMARRLFTDDEIARELDALATARQPDGGWQFNWLAWNPAAALEWRGVVTLDALLTLRAYGRLA